MAGECAKYNYYYQSFSTDLGATWSKAIMMQGMGCVKPRLLALGAWDGFKTTGRKGPIVLSGGRLCVENGEHAAGSAFAPLSSHLLWPQSRTSFSGSPPTEWLASIPRCRTSTRVPGPSTVFRSSTTDSGKAIRRTSSMRR
jgi:hypothetical protein